jgi:hypothetical protein
MQSFILAGHLAMRPRPWPKGAKADDAYYRDFGVKPMRPAYQLAAGLAIVGVAALAANLAGV